MGWIAHGAATHTQASRPPEGSALPHRTDLCRVSKCTKHTNSLQTFLEATKRTKQQLLLWIHVNANANMVLPHLKTVQHGPPGFVEWAVSICCQVQNPGAVLLLFTERLQPFTNLAPPPRRPNPKCQPQARHHSELRLSWQRSSMVLVRSYGECDLIVLKSAHSVRFNPLQNLKIQALFFSAMSHQNGHSQHWTSALNLGSKCVIYTYHLKIPHWHILRQRMQRISPYELGQGLQCIHLIWPHDDNENFCH